MKEILNLKKGVDNFNFFLTTTAGSAVFILMLIVAYMPGISLFFAEIFSTKTGHYAVEIPYKLSLTLGACFATALVSGTYFAAINNFGRMASWLAFVDALLSLSSYGSMFLPENVDFSQGIINNTRYVFSAVGLLILAGYPAVVISVISEKLSQKYKEAKIHDSVHDEVNKIMASDMINEVKTYVDDKKGPKTYANMKASEDLKRMSVELFESQPSN